MLLGFFSDILEKILIKGGNSIEGTVCISGAKNAALPILAASILANDNVTLLNVPSLLDVTSKINLLQSIGVIVESNGNTLRINSQNLDLTMLTDNAHAKQVRTSVLMLGALIHRQKEIKMPLPYGCDLDARGLDQHILALSNLGVKLEVENGFLKATADRLHACETILDFPSVGATENAIIASSVVEGTSVIRNAAKEPEIVDLANFLNSMGAIITGAGTNSIIITGVKELAGTKYEIIPDRIETGTYIAAVAATGGNLLLRKTNTKFLGQVLSTLMQVGIVIKETEEGVRVLSDGYLYPTDIVTAVYPGFPSDMQPILTTLLSIVEGKSTIKETIYKNRFYHVPELLKMGAMIQIKENMLHITGVKKLQGCLVNAHDLRAGASLLIAGLIANGPTVIENAYQIFRGYEDPIGKLAAIGVDCKLLKD
jgi:UDP-N-acetylglucosamine 1-carboxyvinyltransferase